MRSQIGKLRDEHDALLEIGRRLGRLIQRPAAPPPTDLFAIRAEFTSALIAHLKSEDWVLYPRLLGSREPEVARIAYTFSTEMGGLAKAYSAFADRWGADAIQADWPGYCAATREILAALKSRVDRENHELYPLLERLDRAA